LNDETRGYVESGIDNLLNVEIIESTRWLAAEFPHKNLKDLAIGYVVGALLLKGQAMVLIHQGNITDEDISQILAIIKRRFPEIIEKIERELGK